jgi:predicted Zn-dependent protease
MPRSPLLRCSLLVCLWGLAAAAPAQAAPYTPGSDDQVVERLPLRAADRAARELAALRAQWRRDPNDVDAAVQMAAAYIDQAGAEGDPRYVGYAQSTLQRWWREPEPPAAVRVMRAIILQYDHRFDEALADLAAAVREDPDDAQAWSWATAIQLVRTNLPAARESCEKLAALTPDLVGAACRAQIAALTGRAFEAATALRAALRAAGGDDPALRLWALTRLAETEERR